MNDLNSTYSNDDNISLADFSKNDRYLIEENYRNGNDDFYLLFAGDRKFVVPFLYTENCTYKQALARFETNLFDFEHHEMGKYNKEHKRVKRVEWEGREFIVPFGYKGEVEPEKIAKMWLDKAEAKYNMIINAHRALFNNDIDVAPIRFGEKNAEEYVALLQEFNIPVMADKKTPEMIKVVKALENIGENSSSISGGSIRCQEAKTVVSRPENEERKVVIFDIDKEMDEKNSANKRNEVKAKPVMLELETKEKPVEKEVKTKSVETRVDKKVETDVNKKLKDDNVLISEEKRENKKKIVKENLKDDDFFKVLKNKVKKKIIENEFKAIKKYVTQNYKVAVLAGALGIAGINAVDFVNTVKDRDKDSIEAVKKVKTNKIVQNGVYTTYRGKKLVDKYGNLEAINNMRAEITAMLIAVEGYTNGGFGDTRGNPTVGIGMTILYDENGKPVKVTNDDKLDDKQIIVKTWQAIEEDLLPVIANIDRKCSKEELGATVAFGYCIGPNALKNSEYLKSVNKNEGVEVLSRKLTGFRNPSGQVKREYLLANILEGRWNIEDLKDMPVYFIKDKGFLHCAIYTLDFDEICPVKKDKNGRDILDKYNNQIPKADKDNFCSLYLDKSDEILNKLCVPNPKFGNYKTVGELLPEHLEECFEADFCLSEKQKELTAFSNKKGNSIDYLQAANNLQKMNVR